MTVQDQVQKSLKLVGRVLGDKFKLTACIGIGGSGDVYRADQMALGRTVVVKILNEELCADPRMVTRCRGEAMSASRLNHPNCVSIIDYGQSSDVLLYLAMEYVKGPTLTQLLVNENPLAVERVIDLVAPASARLGPSADPRTLEDPGGPRRAARSRRRALGRTRDRRGP